MQNEIGMVGLGVMGRNLVLNIAEHGFPVSGYDKDRSKVEQLRKEAAGQPAESHAEIESFIQSLRTPRVVMMLVPAGPPVDAVIHDLLPYLASGDLLIDGGNSYFKDTDLRGKALSENGIDYLGVGISGGEHGARFGPSMMPGGPEPAYERVRTMFEAVSAHVNSDPCVAYLGPRSAGHYVKMVHNGIEYGLLRLIAESYDLMRRGLGLTETELSDVFEQWNRGILNSYLIEITSRIFLQKDPHTGRPLVDLILDEARQKGTGKWTSEDAMTLQVPLMTIDVSVAMRNLSMLKQEREAASDILPGPSTSYAGDRQAFINQLESALYLGFIITFAQGMSLLRKGSDAYSYGLNLETIARIWRGGCIIRARLLEDIRTAFKENPALQNLLVAPIMAQQAAQRQADLRSVVRTAVDLGISAPALMTTLAYYDGYRSAWMPANLIQAQRDYFGAHTYERVDEKGIFHTEWDASSEAGTDSTL